MQDCSLERCIQYAYVHIFIQGENVQRRSVPMPYVIEYETCMLCGLYRTQVVYVSRVRVTLRCWCVAARCYVHWLVVARLIYVHQIDTALMLFIDDRCRCSSLAAACLLLRCSCTHGIRNKRKITFPLVQMRTHACMCAYTYGRYRDGMWKSVMST